MSARITTLFPNFFRVARNITALLSVHLGQNLFPKVSRSACLILYYFSPFKQSMQLLLKAHNLFESSFLCFPLMGYYWPQHCFPRGQYECTPFFLPPVIFSAIPAFANAFLSLSTHLYPSICVAENHRIWQESIPLLPSSWITSRELPDTFFLHPMREVGTHSNRSVLEPESVPWPKVI